MAEKHAGSIKNYDESFLMCRGEAHYWMLIGYYRTTDPKVLGRIMLCDRCDTQRKDRWERATGYRLASSYVYPDGYQIDHSKNPADKADIRKEVMRRVDVWANEDQMMNGRRRKK